MVCYHIKREDEVKSHMNTLLFGGVLCLKSMLQHIRLNIVVVASLCVGMIIPLVALADIQYFAVYAETARSAIADSCVYYYSVTPQMETAEIYKRVSESPLIDKAAIVESTGRSIEYQQKKFYESVNSISMEQSDFFPLHMLEGRGFEAADFDVNSKVCVIEEHFFVDKHLQGKVGETILIDGEAYCMVGICRKIDSRGAIWIPWSPAHPVQGSSGQIRLNIQYGKGANPQEVDELIRPLFDTVISSGTLEQQYQRNIKNGIQLCISILVMILPLILFSLINCFAVIQGKIRRMRYQFAVEMAYGARGKDIFGGCLLENLILCGIAILMDIMLMPLIIPHIPAEIDLVWNIWVYLEMFLLMLVICLFLSWLSTRSILKISLARTLKGD